MKKLMSMAMIGLAAKWLLDPEQGKQRRASLVERFDALRGGIVQRAGEVRESTGGVRETVGTVRETAGSVGETVVAKAKDVIPGVGGRFNEDAATLAGDPDDARLTDKVETELFRDPDVPKGAINVNVEFGKVVLRGQVDSQEMIDALVARARGIEGVMDVESLLHTPGTPAPMHE